ncbi:hypothetical protein [Methylobacterium sp. CM6257]
MPLPTSVPETAAEAFNRVLSTAFSVKTNLTGVRDLIAGGTIYMDNLIGLYQALNASQGVGLSIQGVEGLSDYAKQAVGNPDYDIDAEFMASVIACKAVTDWLLANMPSDGNGGFLGWRLQQDSTVQRVIVDRNTLGDLAALIDTALATFA